MNTPTFTPISETGRFKLIRKLKQLSESVASAQGLIKGIGDDASVSYGENGSFGLQTIETFVEGVDFDLTYTPMNHLGYKLISAALSDIYAMNGKPKSVLVAIGVPNKISTEMIEQLYTGIVSAVAENNCTLVGGDVTASQSTLVISVSSTGTVSESAIAYRSGAQIDDAICVTGDLGAAYAGLKILLREKSVWTEEFDQNEFQPDLSDYEYVIRKQLVPQTRADLIASMEAQGIVPTSMIDISKNTLQDLLQLLTSSQKGGIIYQAALPVALETRAVADEFEDDVDQYALQGGEDFELLFTLPESDVNKLVNHFKDFVVIGKVLKKSEGVKMQTSNGDTMHFDTSEME